MALQCTVCSAELEALGARRCRKCRQLVCDNCIEPDSKNQSEGACCVSCASQQEVLTAQTQEEEEEAQAEVIPQDAQAPQAFGAPLILPTWAWAVIGVMLSVIFGLIVYYPTHQLRSLKSDLFSSDIDRRERGVDGLVALGTDSALDVLVDAVRSGPPPTQLSAAKAMGDFPSPRVPELIRDLLHGQIHTPERQAALEESLIRHQSIFESVSESDQ